MDDIIIWSQIPEGLYDATREVLRWQCENRLCIAPEKCEWAQHQIEFQGYIVSGQGVEMMCQNVSTLKKIEPVRTLKNIQQFLGLANFYERFIKYYSKIILPMTNSTFHEIHAWQCTLESE